MTAFLLFGGIAAAFFLSAVAGFGGSLILTPLLVFTVGVKQGIALSSLLLAVHNGFKLLFYRNFLPIRAAFALAGATLVGAFLGSTLLVALPDQLAVFLLFLFSFLTILYELIPTMKQQFNTVSSKIFAPWIAFLAGISSGSSGTSGPLKGLAIKTLQLDALHHVGAATLISFVGDFLKLSVFTAFGLLSTTSLQTLGLALPLMPLCAWAGYRFNRQNGEKSFTAIFWIVIVAYLLRAVGVFSVFS